MEGEKIPPGVALMLGKAFHKGAETNLRQKIESHEDLPAKEIVDIAVAAFDTETAGGFELTGDESLIGASKVLGEAKDLTAKLAYLHATEQAPDYQPVAVEHMTRIVLPNATHDLLAVTDVRTEQGVTDFKTAARSMPQTAVEDSTQLTIYAAAFQVDTGRMPEEVRLDVAIKTKKPKRQVLRSRRDERDLQVLVNRVNEFLRTIEAGIFLPAPVGSWQCSPRWCGFHPTCRFVNSERRDAAESEG
jgi:hypothetical protein